MGGCCPVDKCKNSEETRTIIQTIKISKKVEIIKNHSSISQNHEVPNLCSSYLSSHKHEDYKYNNQFIKSMETKTQLYGEIGIFIETKTNNQSMNRGDTETYDSKPMLFASSPLTFNLNKLSETEKFSNNEEYNKRINFEHIDREIQDVFS